MSSTTPNPNPPLTTEQKFRVAQFTRQLDLLDLAGARQLCLIIYQDLLARETITKSILNDCWGIGDRSAVPFEPEMLEVFGLSAEHGKQNGCSQAQPVDSDDLLTPNRFSLGESIGDGAMPFNGWTDL